MDRFVGKTVLVTGATSGIGEAAARLFYAEGATVLACGRNEAAGETSGGRWFTVPTA